MNWEIFWNAFSAIGSITASITALFIVKWNIKLSNKKNLEFFLNEFSFTPDDDKENKQDFIEICLANTGNRRISIKSLAFKLTNVQSRGFQNWAMDFPCVLEIEEIKVYTIQKDFLKKWIDEGIKDYSILSDEYIVLFAKDLSDKEYSYNTKIKYREYMAKSDIRLYKK